MGQQPNQQPAAVSPGSYATHQKFIFAWHLDDVLQHVSMDLEQDVTPVTEYVRKLTDEELVRFDRFIDDVAEPYDDPVSEVMTKFSADLYNQLQQLANHERELPTPPIP